MSSPYKNIDTIFHMLDARTPSYRFSLEDDIPWLQKDAPGLHFAPSFLRLVGIDPQKLQEHPEAYRAFQWGVGLEISHSFSILENYLLRFVDEEHTELQSTKSMDVLYQEEQKHIALFDRYADLLRHQHPEWVDAFEDAFAPYKPALMNPYRREEYTDKSVQHYFFWLKTLFFEEYTVYLHERFLEERDCMQPVWLAAHACHRKEEQQHIITDAAYLRALNIDSHLKKACSRSFWSHIEQTFTMFLGISATKDFVRTMFPECADILPDIPTCEMPIYRDILYHPRFKKTRSNAPFRLPIPAQIKGPPLSKSSSLTLLDALETTILNHPNKGVHVHLPNDEHSFFLYSELKELAFTVLSNFPPMEKHAPIVLFADDPKTFLPLFWACLYGGFVPVPIGGKWTAAQLENKLSLLGEQVHIFITQRQKANVESISTNIVLIESLFDTHGRTPILHTPQPDDVAFIQFSSGSTSEPKGIQLTHSSLLQNCNSIIVHQQGIHTDRFLSWLPLYHDMGLIGYHLLPIVLGAEQVLIKPFVFLRDPMLWLELLSQYQTTVTACPNFGLQYCLSRWSVDRVEPLDLSAIHCLLNGAEPISFALTKKFCVALKKNGLNAKAMTPAYGLAEGTLCITAKTKHTKTDSIRFARDSIGRGRTVVVSEEGVEFVSCGVPIHGVDIRIIDKDGGILHEGEVGEIEISGPNLFHGYLPNPPKGQACYRTGDLGVWYEGSLYIIGRTKEFFIQNGCNIYAVDIEQNLEALPQIRAAVAYQHPDDYNFLCLGIVAERNYDEKELWSVVRNCLGATFSIEHYHMKLLRNRDIPRTTSGKRQRYRLTEAHDTPITSSKVHYSAPESCHLDLKKEIRNAWSTALRTPTEAIKDNVPFSEYGGSSIAATHVHVLLEEALKQKLPYELLTECNTIEEMVSFCTGILPSNYGKNTQTVDTTKQMIRPQDIAIVGMSIHVSQAKNRTEFISVLKQSHDTFAQVPAERWNHEEFSQRLPNIHICPRGSFIDAPLDFDFESFQMSESEATQLNPQYRLFLETAMEALEDAGVSSGNIGVFASQGEPPSNFHGFLHALEQGDSTIDGLLANSTNNMLSSLVSRHFDLHGPSVVVQGACASSLLATHQACISLQNHECEAVVVGAVELIHTPTLYALFSKAGVLSPSGMCRPFTEQADGFVPGEGSLAVVLKRVNEAINDGDRIYAIIKGSAVGNDGSVFGSMTPNPSGQRSVIRRALKKANVDPSDIQYIETHGTATPVGDGVEIQALSSFYNSQQKLSAIKSKFGHLLAGAGLLSLTASALSIYHKKMFPVSNVGAFNERLPKHSFSILDRVESWMDSPRRMAIHALGIGGTNAHMILESAPEQERKSNEQYIFCIGARTKQGLVRRAKQLHQWITTNPKVDLSALSASMYRSSMPHRYRQTTLIQNIDQVLPWLQDLERLPPNSKRVSKLSLVFPGPGSQDTKMGSHLLSDDRYSTVFHEVAEICARYDIDILSPMEGSSSSDIVTLQMFVFATSIASARWLQTMGVPIETVIGHSGGEYAAMVISEVLSLKSACVALILRAKAMKQSEPGEMLAVFHDASSLQEIVPTINIAAYNAPKQVTVSGSKHEMQQIRNTLDEKGISYRILGIPCAAHSPSMKQPALIFEKELRSIEGLQFQSPKIPFFSTKTGLMEHELHQEYLVDQLQKPVRFQMAVENAIQSGVDGFLEVGGASVLSPVIQSVSSHVRVFGLRRRTLPEKESILECLRDLFEHGQPILLGNLYKGDVALPPYPFRKQTLPFAFAMEQHQRYFQVSSTPEKESSIQPCAYLQEEDLDLFSQHRVHRVGIAPASWMINKMLIHCQRSHRPTILSQLIVERSIAPRGKSIPWRIQAEAKEGLLLQTKDVNWSTNIRATFDTGIQGWEMPALLEEYHDVSSEDLYRKMQQRDMLYGPDFLTLRTILRHKEQLWLELSSTLDSGQFLIDPTILDGVFQSLAAFSMDFDDSEPFLGFSIGHIMLSGQIEGDCVAHVHSKIPLQSGMDVIRCDIVVIAKNGGTLHLKDFTAKRMRKSSQPLLHSVDWKEYIPQKDASLGTICVLFRGEESRAFALCNQLWEHAKTVLGPLPLGQIDSTTVTKSMNKADVVVVLYPEIRDGISLARIRKQSSGNPFLCIVSTGHVSALFRAYSAEEPMVCSVDTDDSINENSLISFLRCAKVPSNIRYHQNRWETFSLAPFQLVQQPLQFSEKVYWILGGSGGIGTAIASELRRRGATVICTSRSTSSKEGLAGDIGKTSDMLSIRDQILHIHGTIDGVIHCAGVLQDKNLEDCTIEDIQTFTSSKIDGGEVLCSIVDSLQLEALVFVSSMAAFVPSPRQSLYACANAYLYELAQKYRKEGRKTMVIPFGPWKDVGMVKDSKYHSLWEKKGLKTLSEKEGVDSFFHVLQSSFEGDVVVGKLHRRAISIQEVSIPCSVPKHSEVTLSLENIVPETHVVSVLSADVVHEPQDLSSWFVSVLKQFLRCENQDLDMDAPFSELGVDSLMAVDVIHKIEERYRCQLHPTLMFEFPTINRFVGHLQSKLGTAEHHAPSIQVPHISREELLADEVRIAVHCWGLNFIDVLGKHGLHPTRATAQYAPGHEVSGVVVEVGRAVSHFRVGDRVMALAEFGAFADTLITKAYLMQKLPSNWTLSDGASVMVNGLTAISCVERAGQVREKERILIHSAAGGTGLACVQLALSKGAIVYGTIGSAHKRQILEQLGVHRIIVRSEESFEEVIRKECGTVSVIIDGISGDIIEKGLRILAQGGRYVEIAAGAAVQRPVLDPKDIFLKGISFHGVNLAQIMTDTEQFQLRNTRLLSLLSSGVITPHVYQRYSFSELDMAMKMLKGGQTIGKVVLSK